MPDPPSGLLAATRADWTTYWASDVSRAAADVDMGTVEVYFATLDEWRRCLRAGRRQRLVPGSMGQPRLNPMLDRADRLAAMLPKLGAEIGMSPKSRATLALSIGAVEKTIEDLNRESAGDDPDDEYDGITTLVESGAALPDAR